MRYTEIPPSRSLAKYVKCFWTLKADRSPGNGGPEPVMPDGCIELIFNLADPFRRFHPDGALEIQPRSIIAGQMRSFSLIEPSGAIDLFGARFQHSGAAPFFRFPLNELTENIPDLKLVWGRAGRDIEERIQDALSTSVRVELIENELLRLLGQNAPADGITGAAARLIVENGGSVRVENLAAALGINGRRLERRFQQYVGLSPKRFSKIIRFQNFLGAVSSGPERNILDTALSFGYYDQAHLIREFREFSGKTPAIFFGNEHRLSEVFINTP